MLRLLVTSLFLFCLHYLPATAQQKDTIGTTNFKITSADLKQQELHVYLNIQNIDANYLKNEYLNEYSLSASEKIDQSNNLNVISVEKLVNNNPEDKITILFLIDISGSMRKKNRLELAKKAVAQAIKNTDLPPNVTTQLSTFHDFASDNFLINKKTVDEVIKREIKKGKDTDLFNSIIRKTRDFKSIKGKKVIVLLSDGKDESELIKRYDIHQYKRPTAEDAIQEVSDTTLKNNFYLFPIALPGADTTFLKNLVAATPTTFDKYTDIEDASTKLAQIFIDIISGVSANFLVKITPQEKLYYGQQRELSLLWKPNNEIEYRDTFQYEVGTNIHSVDPTNSISCIDWWRSILIGLLLLSILFTVLYYGTPIYKNAFFKKQYIIDYQAKKGLSHIDPLTTDPLETGDKVVFKCGVPILLSSWKQQEQCPNFPNCINNNKLYKCNGRGGPENYNLFAQQGHIKKLTWGWYGGLGGLIGWISFAIYKIASEVSNSYERLHQSLLGNSFFEDHLISVTEVADSTLMGLLLGTGICLTLSIAEEKGLNRYLSYQKITLKIITSLVSFFFLFLGGVIFQYALVQNPFWSGLCTWIIFGLSIGLILAVKSSITWERGVLGGIIASIVGFFIYYFVSSVSNNLVVKMLSLVLIGIIIGIIIVSIVSHLEEFWLTVLEPALYIGHTYPISKWLKSGAEVEIGTSKKCYVFIKWTDDEVREHHAALSYDHGKETVYIQAIKNSEILVNNAIVPPNSRTPLANNDHIRLGRSSISTLVYEEKIIVKSLDKSTSNIRTDSVIN